MSLLTLTPKIKTLPYVHGKAPFTITLRQLLWENQFDCLAFAFPERFQNEVKNIVEKLPHLYAVVARNEEESFAYIPADPCDALIEGVRQAIQRRIPFYFIEDDTQIYYKELLSLPDAHLVSKIGFEKYYDVCKPFLTEVKEEVATRHRARLCTARLQELETKYQKILFMTDIPLQIVLDEVPGDLAQKEKALEKYVYEPEERWDDYGPIEQFVFPINPEHAYFALSELPFFASEFEKGRLDPLAGLPSYTQLIKKIFLEARDQHLDNPRDEYSISRLQIALQYLRNLCIIDNRLTPDLHSILHAAKGVFGGVFAQKIFEAARYYPFFRIEQEAYLHIGIEFIQSPYDQEPLKAINLLTEEPREWRPLPIKPEPNQNQKRKYRFEWDANGMCSHLAEDIYIENFNRHVRSKTVQKQIEQYTKTEKFTTSLKDGLDIRETLRNWHTGQIYVKEIPPTPKSVDTVVVLFDIHHDDKYPFHTTWYAEHANESTLTFYATDPFENLIGPGIAEAKYGGFSLLFPPETVEDIFSFTSADLQKLGLAELLVYGACLFSKEKSISIISYAPPNSKLERIAKSFGKKFLWIPLQTYSRETLRRLQIVHILNGRKVRSWANRFIDPRK